MTKRSVAAWSLCLLVSACASSVAVERVKMGDVQLPCAELAREFQEADRFRKDAEGKKGATGTNVAAVIFFWPALFVTYGDANEAIRAADERKAHLTKLYSEKNCPPLQQSLPTPLPHDSGQGLPVPGDVSGGVAQ